MKAHILQRSNLRYMKTILEHFDARQHTDFRNSCLGFLSDVPNLQFSTQLIQQLVFRSIRIDKAHELWFNLQGHLAQFGLQEITCADLEKAFLRASTSRANQYKPGLALIIEGVFNALDSHAGLSSKFGKKTCTVHGFSIAMQIWAFEAIPIGEKFGRRLGQQSPQLLNWTSTKQLQQRTYDAFFKNVQGNVGNSTGPSKEEESSRGGSDDDEESGSSEGEKNSEESEGDGTGDTTVRTPRKENTTVGTVTVSVLARADRDIFHPPCIDILLPRMYLPHLMYDKVYPLERASREPKWKKFCWIKEPSSKFVSAP
ncbi:Hypothetical predicted protein [Olea europaea subsp. europaea]|uniref:Uncharacterized protein n=1 Tax=Olea europaea subsp. europaea TaxID=158383 RepID=A0A8S0SP81_OLEEU|nr:Hypothetical predicted protein [Olea europaea subsp. europaea]